MGSSDYSVCNKSTRL